MRKTSKFYRLMSRINFFGMFPRIGKFDKEWDKTLNELLDNQSIVNINPYTIKFSTGEEVWIANHPYCSGYEQNMANCTSFKYRKLPSHKTVWKLETLVIKYIEEKGLNPKMFL